MKVNEFKADLQYSLDQQECELLDVFYQREFPGICRIELIRDMDRQRRGIDKILHFNSGYQITLDEKKRRKDYGDILLETWSQQENEKRGWLYSAQCDYIVYAIMPTYTVYLLPVLLLKKAWHNNKDCWLDLYQEVQSHNKDYTTINIAIPIEVLMKAIQDEMKYRLLEVI